MLFLFLSGESAKEKQLKNSNAIVVHTPEQIERMRRSCKVLQHNMSSSVCESMCEGVSVYA